MKKLFLVALLLFARLLHAQDGTGWPFPDTVSRPTFVAEQWQAVLSCSGLMPQPGGNLADVHWLIVPPKTLHDDIGLLLGQWADPDTIRLDAEFVDTAWVVEHELLHHLMRGPPGEETHPWVPFAFPCGVMDFQHEVGGIMSGHRYQKERAQRHRAWRVHDIVLATTYVTLQMLDYSTTLDAIRRSEPYGHEFTTPCVERNPIIGCRPSPMKLRIYNLAGVAGAFVVGAKLRGWKRTVWFAAISVMELQALQNNVGYGFHITVRL